MEILRRFWHWLRRWAMVLVIVVVLLICIAVVVVSIAVRGVSSPDVWATVAAALAVVTAVIGGWSSYRLVEMEEERLRACPVISLDLESRYMLAQVRLENRGQSPAYDIRVEWESGASPPSLQGGLKAEVMEHLGAGVLQAGDAVLFCLGVTHEVIERSSVRHYRGNLSWREREDGGVKSRPFVLDIRQYKPTLTSATERPRTEYELQRLPQCLETIAKELKEIEKAMRGT